MRLRRKPLDWQADFRKYQRGRNLSDESVNTYIWALRVITQASGKEVWELTSDDLLAFMETSPYPVRTTAQVLTAAKAGHRWAAVRGLTKLNGILAVQPPKIPRDEARPPASSETARRLLEGARTAYQVRVVFLSLYAGCRVSECARMTPEHLKNDRLRFVGKGGVKRSVPIHPELEQRLEMIFATDPPSKATMNVTMKRLRERLGATDILGDPATTHTLRRTCSTAMYRGGARWEVADTVLGHALPGSGGRYIDIGWDVQVQAVLGIDYYTATEGQMRLF